MEIKVSVIIPMYNGARTIRKCLEQLNNQTFSEEYEVLIIDDASTDDSVYLVEKMIAEFSRSEKFKVIRCEQNGRAGRARNIGVKSAKGEYILFVDQDDYPDVNMLEVLYGLTEYGKIDCTSCDICDKEGSAYSRVYMGRKYSLTNEERSILMHKHGYVFAMLIRKEILEKNNIFFPEKVMYEDSLYGYGLYACIESFANTEQKLYFRELTEDSQTFSMTKKKMLDRIEATKWYLGNFLTNDRICEWKEELYGEAFYYIFLSCTFMMLFQEELCDYKVMLDNRNYVKRFNLMWKQILDREKRFSKNKMLVLRILYYVPVLLPIGTKIISIRRNIMASRKK